MLAQLKKLYGDNRGVTAIEYGLISALISVVIIIALEVNPFAAICAAATQCTKRTGYLRHSEISLVQIITNLCILANPCLRRHCKNSVGKITQQCSA